MNALNHQIFQKLKKKSIKWKQIIWIQISSKIEMALIQILAISDDDLTPIVYRAKSINPKHERICN